MTKWEGLTVYPGGQHNYGGDIIGKHADHWKADLVIATMDQWALPKETLRGRNVAFWIPVDCSPLSTRDADGLRSAQEVGVKVHLLALTHFAQRQLKETGYDSIGSGSLFAKSSLKKRYRAGLTLDEAVTLGIESLYDAADDDTATGGPDLIRKIYPVVMTATAEGNRRLTDEEAAEVTEAVVERRRENPGG